MGNGEPADQTHSPNQVYRVGFDKAQDIIAYDTMVALGSLGLFFFIQGVSFAFGLRIGGRDLRSGGVQDVRFRDMGGHIKLDTVCGNLAGGQR
jgi:hypothetical protein